MNTLNPDFRDLVHCLNSAGVRYLILGGYAVNFHGYHRNTKDLDVWVAVEEDNARRLAKALVDFGFSATSVRLYKFIERGQVFTFGREPSRVDLLTDPAGVSFAECYERRVEAEFGGVVVPFIGLDDLRKNKKAAGRFKDAADLDGLPNVEPKKGRRRRPK